MQDKIAIIGAGWVGKFMYDSFGGENCVVFDPHITPEHPLYNKKVEWYGQVNQCRAAFVCVPTPAKDDNTLDCSIVEQIINWCECPLIIIRSTVNPGFTDSMKQKYGKRIVFQPEYLGETPGHPNLNPTTRQFMILGGDKKDTAETISLYTRVYNANISIRQVSALEAEVIKLTENRAIAFKVIQCHELYLACKAAGVDYYTIRDAVFGDDPRFNLWFTLIYRDEKGKEKLGFESSKCLSKDVPAWCAWAESVGSVPQVTRAIIRTSKRWGIKDDGWDKFMHIYKTTGFLIPQYSPTTTDPQIDPEYLGE